IQAGREPAPGARAAPAAAHPAAQTVTGHANCPWLLQITDVAGFPAQEYCMETFVQDLRFGLRMLRKSPGSGVLVVLTFALGIGVNTAIFSVVDAVALRPLAVAAPDHIVRIVNEDPTHPDR